MHANHDPVPPDMLLRPPQIPYELAISQVKDHAIFMIDPTGRVVTWNEGVENVLGWNEQEWVGQLADVTFTPEAVRAGIPQKEFQEAAATGRANEDRWMIHRSGRRFFASGVTTSVRNDSGQLVGYMKVMRDLTDVRAAEQAMLSIRDFAYSFDRQGRFVFVNRSLLKLLGLTKEEVIGKTFHQLPYPDELAARLQREIEHVVTTGRELIGETQYTSPTGQDGYYEYIFTPSFAPDGSVEVVVGSTRDITDRKLVEKEGERTEARSRLLADAGITLTKSLAYEGTLCSLANLLVPRLADWCTVDLVADENRINRLCVVHADRSKQEFATALQQRYPPKWEGLQGVAHVIRTGETIWSSTINDADLAGAAQDQEHLRILRAMSIKSYIVVPLHSRGRVLGALTLLQAESDRHYTAADVALAEDLGRRAGAAIENADLYASERAARSDAERASQLKDEFLATLSHELRTPLNAILGWAQILRMGGRSDSETERGLDVIERNSRLQSRLIEDLLDMNRIVSGKMRLDVQSVNAADVVAAAIESVRPAAAAKEIRLETILDPSITTLRADPGRLQQIVWNFLSNAVKFTPKGGKVQVSLQRVNSHVEIEVTDTGVGIAPQFLPYVFDRFRQADGSTTRRHGGLGLGLAIVKNLAELHGGKVYARSGGDGSGSTFILHLPLSAIQSSLAVGDGPAKKAIQMPDHGVSLATVTLAGISVLVVDDDDDARTIVSRVLEESQAMVFSAASAADAIKILQKERPTVLVSDISMPDEDGYELLRRVRALPESQGGNTPAAALTAFVRSQDRTQALRAGYQVHISKPVEPAELIAVVASLAAKSRRYV